MIYQMENIAGYEFDLSKRVYLTHPGNKFWEGRLDGVTVHFRVGKGSGETESQLEQISKAYSSAGVARTSLINKIEEKLIKGYFTKEAVLVKQHPLQKERSPIRISEKRAFSGQYYEKGDLAIKIEVNGCKVKITRIDKDKKERFEVKDMGSHQDAVQFCLSEENWAKGEGYVPKSSKFIYTFVQDQEPLIKSKRKDKGKGNFLSITDMTDEAMSHSSRGASSAKSDRSFVDDGKGDYVPTKLGSPSSTCIKVLLAETFQEDTDPSGMIMSEKLDGVRCFWTGSVMYSRNANRFFFPKFFTRNWPNSQLDGELFIDRGKFSQTLSAVKKSVPIDSEWQNVRYLVFDCPGYKKPFRNRIQALEEVLKGIDNKYIKCHAHRPCDSFADLFTELTKVNKLGGQGLMLRDPQSLYENRRSKSLLKVKTFHDDQATVIGYKDGTGRCQGMVGALRVRNTHGIQFEVGSGLTDAERRKPPKIGTKITYKYQQFNKDSGKPRFPTFLRKFDDTI